MVMYNGIPPYNPDAPKRLQSLRKAYGAVASLYDQCLSPEALTGGAPNRLLPGDKVYYFDEEMRRAMLAGLETIADFKREIAESEGDDQTDARLKAGLREAFSLREKTPYNKVNTRYPGPFHSMENTRFGLYEYQTYHPHRNGTRPVHQTLVVAEIAEDCVNLCFTQTRKNLIRVEIDHVADSYYAHLRAANLNDGLSLKNKPVNVYMHIPTECGYSRQNEFSLVDPINKAGPTGVVPLIEMKTMPRLIDYAFYKAHNKITNEVALNTLYNDFRGFALRAM